MSDCCCLEIQYINSDTGVGHIVPLVAQEDSYNGKCVYLFEHDDGTIFYWWWQPAEQLWVMSPIIGDQSNNIATWKVDVNCPATEGDPEIVGIPSNAYISDMLTRECLETCDCILLGILNHGEDPYSENISASGIIFNNRPTYAFIYNSVVYYLWFRADSTLVNSGQWVISGAVGSLAPFLAETTPSPTKDIGCPIDLIFTTKIVGLAITVEEGVCVCIPIEERIFSEYDSIQLPQVFMEEDRGFFKCCETQLVLASTTSTDTWKNDITSAWVKLSDPSDSATILLTKDGQPTSYPISIITFPNEPNAIYRTIYWRDVLSSDGEGCYKIEIAYTIGGMTGNFTWGTYDLKEYSIERALGTARIRVFLNLKQAIEDINFTNSMVEDTIRFYGFIGDRQPNMEIDNLIYQDRTVRTVVRENLDTYTIKTDPYTNETLKRLTDLYLLSENDMFISDYNAFNNSYEIQDVPVTVQESPEIDYLDQFQRKAVLTCVVGDKTKNKRTFY